MPPVLLVLEEDDDARGRIETQLVQRYGRDYRVVSVGDGDEALRVLTGLADESAEVALVLVGKSLATSADGALLDRVRQVHPHAKRALVVPLAAWADNPTAEVMRGALAIGRIDHYVPEPTISPDEVFHEAVSNFLLEWAHDRRNVPHTVHIVGEEWSGRAYELRTIFERCAAPHAFCLADSDEGRRFLALAGPDVALPLMVLPDGTVLSDPSDAEIAEAAGAPSDFETGAFDLVIVGAGPAGLSAAVYGAADGLRTLVLDEGGIGGQARSSSLIRNYLGFAKGVSGSRLAEQAYEQARSFGASFVFMHRVTDLRRLGDQLSVSLVDGRDVTARAVILATGASYRRLGVDSLERLNGAGVFYGGPASEAPGLNGKDVYVAGGGNSGGQAALHLARFARSVTLVIRADSLEASMSHYMARAVGATSNVEVRTGTTVVGGGGGGQLQQLVLCDAATGKEETVAADALFVLIGARPHTKWLPSEVARDDDGFILTGDDLPDDCDWPLERRPLTLETSMPGVLAAGDVRHASVKRVASAVGEGSIAAKLVHTVLASEGQPSTPSIAAG
jgi:thioredoxin reductase (NADPH)